MKDCGTVIEREIIRRRLKKNELAEFLGMSPQNFSKLLHKPSVDAALLEKICEYMNVDPMAFFDFRPNVQALVGEVTQNNTLSTGAINLEASGKQMYERLIEEKDARISALEKTILALEKTIEILTPQGSRSTDA